eukprot:TRINITY_DN15033_c0_g1_i1.p1 TRINITY_DN15033_c0_g1~~TRINITY_DN15033_c0_g1_i1.p1  ORF type:complete len:460 (+),score=76.41 TRINITY_DN15033_c0_g1_i1:229-1608(+)
MVWQWRQQWPLVRGSVAFAVAVFAAGGLWLQDHAVPVSADGYCSLPSWIREWDVFRPAGFHHTERDAALAANEPYFEGWYMKVVSDTGEVVAFIPGVFHAVDPRRSHAFVIVFDSHGAASKTDFALSEFIPGPDGFELQIGERNHFSLHGLTVDLPGIANGSLQFSPAIPWPVTVISPGVMGPFAWAPWMECSHGVLSLSHRVDGRIQLNERHGGRRLEFSEGDGYVEKDRGTHFPQTWVWLQSNSFRSGRGWERSEVSLSASIGRVPVPLVGRRLGIAFPGFIVGLMLNGTLYRFTTYTGAVTSHLEISGGTVDRVEWRLEDAQHRLYIDARNDGNAGNVALWGPRDGTAMEQYVAEGLSAVVDVRLVRKAWPWSEEDGDVVYTGSGAHGGIELMAKTEELFTPAMFIPGYVVTPLHHPLAAACLLVAALVLGRELLLLRRTNRRWRSGPAEDKVKPE